MINESGDHVKGTKFVSRLLIVLQLVSVAEVEDAGLEKNCIVHTVISSWITSLLKGETKATLGLRLWYYGTGSESSRKEMNACLKYFNDSFALTLAMSSKA